MRTRHIFFCTGKAHEQLPNSGIQIPPSRTRQTIQDPHRAGSTIDGDAWSGTLAARALISFHALLLHLFDLGTCCGPHLLT